jgi:hypothetical protein
MWDPTTMSGTLPPPALGRANSSRSSSSPLPAAAWPAALKVHCFQAQLTRTARTVTPRQGAHPGPFSPSWAPPAPSARSDPGVNASCVLRRSKAELAPGYREGLLPLICRC